MIENQEGKQGLTDGGEFKQGSPTDVPAHAQPKKSLGQVDGETGISNASREWSGQQELSHAEVRGGRQGKVLGGWPGEIQTNRPQTPKRTSRALWLVAIALAVALAGETWYGWLALQKHDIQLSQLPKVGEALSALSARLGTTDAKLGALSAEWDSLVRRVGKLDHKVSSEFQLVRKQTQELITQAQGRMQAELDERTQRIDTRLSRVESDQRAEREHLAQLQEQIETRVREQVAAVRSDTASDLAGLHHHVEQSQGELHALARKVDRRRFDFEAAKNRTLEIVPGISLRITETDVRYQRYAGYLWYLPDTRTLWLPHVGVQQPVAFCPKAGGQPYELVVTNVAKSSVVGYLLQPLDRGPNAPDETANQAPAGPLPGS